MLLKATQRLPLPRFQSRLSKGEVEPNLSSRRIRSSEASVRDYEWSHPIWIHHGMDRSAAATLGPISALLHRSSIESAQLNDENPNVKLFGG